MLNSNMKNYHIQDRIQKSVFVQYRNDNNFDKE